MDFTNLCIYLTPEERLQIFDMLCQKLQNRLPERIWLATQMRIPRTHVYRYLDRTGKKRRIPGPETTALIIDALLARGGRQQALPIMKTAMNRMVIATLSCDLGMRYLNAEDSSLDKEERNRLTQHLERDTVSDLVRIALHEERNS